MCPYHLALREASQSARRGVALHPGLNHSGSGARATPRRTRRYRPCLNLRSRSVRLVVQAVASYGGSCRRRWGVAVGGLAGW